MRFSGEFHHANSKSAFFGQRCKRIMCGVAANVAKLPNLLGKSDW
jgi:hypothetical protein